MNYKFWNLFHDGDILAVEGIVPGNLDFKLDAIYLREQLDEPTSLFHLRIIDCDLFEFQSFENENLCIDISCLQNQDLEILSAEEVNGIISITTSGGVIKLRYQSEELSLDNGRILEFSDIASAANQSVNSWKNKNNIADPLKIDDQLQ